jgi:hypothetical protein
VYRSKYRLNSNTIGANHGAEVSVFGQDTLDMIEKLYGLSKSYADMLGVDPFLAMGGPAEELDTINRSPNGTWEYPYIPSALNSLLDTWVAGLPDWVGYWSKEIFDYSHERIKRNIAEANNIDQTHGVSDWDKARNPVLVDLGHGNIKLGTAIDLLERYNDKYPDSDPLHLKKYEGRYDDLARDLSMHSPLNATAKFAVLEAAEAIDFFKRRAPRTWAKADQFERLGLVATYYNRGREKMDQVATEEERHGEYRPVPGFGGEKAAENGWALAMATGREPPFSPTGLAAGRRVDRASVPGYSGDGGRRRDKQDPWRYEDWKHRGQGDTRSRRASVNPSKGAGRPAEASREVPVRAVSSARLPGLMGAIPIGSETNALDVLDESGLLRSFPPRRMRPTDPGRGPRKPAPPPAAGKVERRSQAAPPPFPGGLLGPTWVRRAGAAGEPELHGAPGMPDEAHPAGVQPWSSMSGRAIGAVGIKGLGELLAGMSNSAAASRGSSFLAPEGRVAPSGFPPMSPAGLAALRQRAAMPGRRQPVLARSHGGPSSARPHWEDSVSALDAYLRDPQSEVPDFPAAGPAALTAELDTYPAGGLFGRRFAGSKRAAVRRHKRGAVA